MEIIFDNENCKLYRGFADKAGYVIEPESVDCIITSPPYYGLRDYGSDAITIWAEENCNHQWQEYNGRFDKKNPITKNAEFEICSLCNGSKFQLGLEPTVNLYIGHLTVIFRNLKRILKNTGTCFIVIGDSYLDDGNLAMVPFRLALELKNDGWFIRNILVWNKRFAYRTETGWETNGNGLPESVDNRFSKSTEFILFLTKQKTDYYFNIDGLKLGWKDESILRAMRGVSGYNKYAKLPLYGGGGGLNKPRPHIKKYNGKLKSVAEELSSIRARETRMCDKINSDAFPTVYGTGFYRFYDKDDTSDEMKFVLWLKDEITNKHLEEKLNSIFGVYLWRNWLRMDRPGILMPTIEQWNIVKNLLGYENTPFDWLIKKHGFKRPPDSFFINTQPRTETHFATFPDDLVYALIVHGCPENGIVLDPFAGIGTSGVVAYNLKRKWIGIEPVSEFIEIAKKILAENTSQQWLELKNPQKEGKNAIEKI